MPCCFVEPEVSIIGQEGGAREEHGGVLTENPGGTQW